MSSAKTKNFAIYDYIKENCLRKGEYVLSSGLRTDKYFDLRMLTMKSSLNNNLCHAIDIELISHGISSDNFMVIGGMESGSIPLVKAYSLHHGKDCFYVRKHAKDHGMQQIVEGITGPYLLMDDVTTTGYSMWKVQDTIGYEAEARFCIIDRRREDRERNYDIEEIISLFKESDFE
jgi:orotate phosphoribosyltransferase